MGKGPFPSDGSGRKTELEQQTNLLEHNLFVVVVILELYNWNWLSFSTTLSGHHCSQPRQSHRRSSVVSSNRRRLELPLVIFNSLGYLIVMLGDAASRGSGDIRTSTGKACGFGNSFTADWSVSARFRPGVSCLKQRESLRDLYETCNFSEVMLQKAIYVVSSHDIF